MGLGQFFEKTAEEYIEDLLNSGHPSMEGITLEKLMEGPIRPSKPSDNPADTQLGAAGGIYQDELSKGGANFQTRSERFEFYSELMKEYGEELPVYIEPAESPRQPLGQKYPLSLLHRHSKTRFHTHFTEVDWLRELDPEPVLQINPVDAERRGIQEGDMVKVFNDRGRVKLKARIHQGIRPGVVTVGEGWQARHFAEGCYQELTASTENPALEAVTESQGQMNDILVEVKKAEEG
jgi:molybdopterin-containing oxidoreductase family molybdopterin binding subunit